MKCIEFNRNKYLALKVFLVLLGLIVSSGCDGETGVSSELNKEIAQKISEFTSGGSIFFKRGADTIDPLYFKVLSYGTKAIPCLLEALENKSIPHREKQFDFVCMLAQIGDSRAYPKLRILYFEQITEVRKWRYGISLGACLSAEKIEDYNWASFCCGWC